MSFHGYQNGMPIYDYLDEVPDNVIESGQDFILMHPPQELIDDRGGTVIKGNSFTLFTFIGWCILLWLVATVTVAIFNSIGFVFHGYQGKKIDDNLFEAGDGSVWRRNSETGEWEMVTGPKSNWIWAVVAIGLIAVAIIVLLAFKGEDIKKTIKKKKGGKKK